MKRRDTFKLLAAAPAAAFAWTPADVVRARAQVDGTTTAPGFFSEHEYATLRVLVDLVLPADDRSGSATDAGVPEFIDFMMTDRPDMQLPMRGGLAWMDHAARRRFGAVFVACTEAQQHELLDAVAYPETAEPEMGPGVAFFSSLRDLTATGFWSSKMGVDDLQYMGNTYVQEWTGCPPEALERLGVEYK